MPGDEIKKDDVKLRMVKNDSHATIPSGFGDSLPDPIEVPTPLGVPEASSIPPPVTSDPVTSELESSSDSGDEYEYVEGDYQRGFIQRVDDLMQELNLSRRHFVIFSGCFSLLIAGIIVSFVLLFHFFGKETTNILPTENTQVAVEQTNEDSNSGFFSNLFNRDSNSEGEQVVEEEELVDVKDEESETVSEEKVGFFKRWFSLNKDEKTTDSSETVQVENNNDDVELTEDGLSIENPLDASSEQSENPLDDKTSITVASQLGDMVVSPMESVGVKASIAYGLATVSEDKLSYYVRTYRKVRNIFNVDLFNYLNTSTNRSTGFDEFLANFKGANEQAKLAYEDLRQEIDLYTNRYDKLNARAIEIENEFFENLDELASEELPSLLDAFQDVTNQKTVVKSELAARTAMAEKYSKAIPIIEKKIEAIEVNRDPFVKGVRVVEFQQVDLDLIIEGN